MDELLCEICGLRNPAEARLCGRCKEPLDGGATQITVSPFASTAPSTQATTRIVSQAQAPTRKVLSQDLEATRVGPLKVDVPKEARPEPRFTAPVRPQGAQAPRPPPNPPARQPSPAAGLPPVRSRTPTQPLTQELLTPPARPIPKTREQPPARPPATAPSSPPQEDLARTTLHFIDTPGAAPAATANDGPKASLRHRLAAQSDLAVPADAPGATKIVGQAPSGLARAGLPQHAAALAIDGVLAALMTVGSALFMVAISRHAYPSSQATAFENFAVWLARSGSQPLRAGLLATGLLVAYGAWGARRGATLGRAAMGLVLVSREGRPVGWDGALWHALGCLLNVVTLGAGSLWAIVDRCNRSWASLLSRTQVVLSHQVVPR